MMQVNNGMQVYRALSDLARRYQFRNREEVCCYGLTVSQCYALQELHEYGKMPSSDLALRLGLDLSSTTRLVDQLVRKKLAIRTKRPEDARIREIEITDTGSRLISRIQADLVTIVDQALDEFPAEVRKMLPQVLRRLTKVLNECATKPQNFIPVEALARTKK
jgi:MarR family transcriptional regulator, 2-MHQ and catechol-resistance regulon repressor